MTSFPFPLLALVTDRTLCRDAPLEEKVTAALAGGVGLVQLREKDLPPRDLLHLAQKIRSLTSGKALFFVNDRVDVALASEADGVQLGEASLPPKVVRAILGQRLLIGCSVHSVEGAVEAQRQGADLLLVGTIFPTESKPGTRAAGTLLLREVHKAVSIPFLAIGGVNRGNVEEAIRCGAHGAAVIRAILESADPQRAAAELVAAMRHQASTRTREGAQVP